MDEPKNANDGRSNGALFSSIVGDSMQQAVLCSYRGTLEVLPNPSTHTEGHVKCQSEYWKAQCGESRMLRLDGGKGRKALPIRIISVKLTSAMSISAIQRSGITLSLKL